MTKEGLSLILAGASFACSGLMAQIQPRSEGGVGAAAQEKPAWRKGVLLDIEKERNLGGIVSGVAIYRSYHTYAIESEGYIYFARVKSKKALPLTINGPVEFQIKGDKVKVRDEKGKVKEMRLTKKMRLAKEGHS